MRAGPDEVIVLVSDAIVLEDIVVESGYSGARMDTDDDGAFVVTQPFVTALVESFKGQGKLHRRFAFEILLAVRPPHARSHSAPCTRPCSCVVLACAPV